MTAQIEQQFIDIQALARLTKWSKRKVRYETERGAFPFIKTSNGSYLYDLEVIKEQMRKNAESAKAAFEQRDTSRYVAGEGVDPTKLRKVIRVTF